MPHKSFLKTNHKKYLSKTLTILQLLKLHFTFSYRSCIYANKFYKAFIKTKFDFIYIFVEQKQYQTQKGTNLALSTKTKGNINRLIARTGIV